MQIKITKRTNPNLRPRRRINIQILLADSRLDLRSEYPPSLTRPLLKLSHELDKLLPHFIRTGALERAEVPYLTISVEEGDLSKLPIITLVQVRILRRENDRRRPPDERASRCVVQVLVIHTE